MKFYMITVSSSEVEDYGYIYRDIPEDIPHYFNWIYDLETAKTLADKLVESGQFARASVCELHYQCRLNPAVERVEY